MVYNADRNTYTNNIDNISNGNILDNSDQNGIEKEKIHTEAIGERSSHGTEHNGADGNEVHTGRGLSDTGISGEQGTGGATHEIRQSEEELPEKSQEGSLRRDGTSGNLEGALPGYPEAGGGEDGIPQVRKMNIVWFEDTSKDYIMMGETAGKAFSVGKTLMK